MPRPSQEAAFRRYNAPVNVPRNTSSPASRSAATRRILDLWNALEKAATSGFRGEGGSFGGGGASGDWEPNPNKPKSRAREIWHQPPIQFVGQPGDPDCSSSGKKLVWENHFTDSGPQNGSAATVWRLGPPSVSAIEAHSIPPVDVSPVLSSTCPAGSPVGVSRSAMPTWDDATTWANYDDGSGGASVTMAAANERGNAWLDGYGGSLQAYERVVEMTSAGVEANSSPDSCGRTVYLFSPARHFRPLGEVDCSPSTTGWVPVNYWDPDPNDIRHKPSRKEVEEDDLKDGRDDDGFFPFFPAFVFPVGAPPFGSGTGTPRQPPKPRTKEKKARTRIARLFKMLDRISESAEVVDAIFESLPCEVQEAAKKKCRKEQAFLDNAGQYGIDQADCKAKAIWDNWDDVDPAIALSNIIRNEIEDKAYGLVAGKTPPGGFSAAQAGSRYASDYRKNDDDDTTGLLTPFNDLVQTLVDGMSDALELTPPRDCSKKGKRK